ncbi:hypothetical protein CR513_09303, partial [Mucuna pruriens]
MSVVTSRGQNGFSLLVVETPSAHYDLSQRTSQIRYDHTIVDILQALAQVVERDQTKDGEDIIEQTINTSQGIQSCWYTRLVVENQKIFRDITCMDAQKVTIVASILAEEVECWWENNQQQDRGRLCSQVEELLRYLIHHWKKIGENFNCVKIYERSMTSDTISHQI